MRHTVWKAFTIWEFEEEIAWLNEMSDKGLQLVHPGLFHYIFEEGEPGEYQYVCECLEHYPNHAESLAYIRFVEETGAEYIGSMKKWVYFRRKKADTSFELNIDLDSRIKHYQRFQPILIICAVLLLAMAVWNMLAYLNGEMHFNLIISALLFLLGIFMLAGAIKSHLSYRRFKKERMLRE